MTAVECIHGLDDPAWCSICRTGPTAPAPPPARERTLIARFDAHCDGCDLPISRGQTIDRWTDGRYRHRGCKP